MAQEPEEKTEEVIINDTPTSQPVVNDAAQLDALTNEMPAVVDDAVSAAEQKDAQIKSASQNVTDKKGRPFDPSKFATDKEGNPILTPTGRFTKIKMPKDHQTGMFQLPPTGDPNAASYEAELRMYAVVWADLYINFGISLFGDEWKPTSEKGMDERQTLIAANETYFREKGIVKIPAWAGLLTAYGLYTLKRINQPRTKNLFQKGVGAVKGFFGNIFQKFSKKKVDVDVKEEK